MSTSRTFRYRGYSPLQVRLRILDANIAHDTYPRVLDTLAGGIKVAASRIDKVVRDAPEHVADMVVDDECQVIENLLGAAYVVCQAPITGVAQAALGVREHVVKEGLPFTAFGEKDWSVRKLGKHVNERYSRVEVLWALGNYFKHREEWRTLDWDNPTGLERYTVPVVRAAGVQEYSTGNLRTGAEALGNRDYADLSVFEEIVRRWADDVREAVRKAVG